MPTHAISAEQKTETHDEFRKLVNMTAAELRKFLATEESRSVGMTHEGEKITNPDQPESVGHHMGERILQIRAAKHANLTDADHADIRKVVGYIHRHTAQRPSGDITNTRWRHSLMNWGHDPTRP